MVRLKSANDPTICIIMHPAGRRSLDYFGQTAEAGTELVDPLHNRQQILQRTDKLRTIPPATERCFRKYIFVISFRTLHVWAQILGWRFLVRQSKRGRIR